MIQNPAIQGRGGEPEMVTGKGNTNPAKGACMYVLVDGQYISANPNTQYKVPKMSTIVISRGPMGANITTSGLQYAGSVGDMQMAYLAIDDFNVDFS